MDLYIYYKVNCDNAEALQEKIGAMQAALTRDYGIGASLKRRPDVKDSQHTWMEVYAGVPDTFEAALDAAVSRFDVTAIIEGTRHTEYFVDISSCA